VDQPAGHRADAGRDVLNETTKEDGVGSALITELTSRECNRYLVEGGDIAVLPVGSVEVLGPHLPVGGRYYLAEAFATLLAEQVEGIRLPVTPYSGAAHTFARPGSAAVSNEALLAYIRAAMDDLHAQGFRRILVLTCSDYLAYYTPQEFYEDHQVAAAGIHLGEVFHTYGPQVGEDSLIVGALRVLGKQELAEKVVAENARLLAAKCAAPALPEELARLLRGGVVGFSYPEGGYPLAPNPELSGEKGEEALRAAAAGLASAVASLREYNEFLAKRGVSRGLTWRGWRWTE
jgi:hypothetical protein